MELLGFFKMIKKVGTDDPRRIVHAFKVGLGLTLVSTFYYVNPVFDSLGLPVIWAVLTVVLVMEFTVGAAVSKGLNRASATFLAGALGVGAHHIAILFGEKGEPIALGVMVFAVAAAATFLRFVPQLKARYDYGVVIFILTFCMVTVSSYRRDTVFTLVKERMYTIVIGVLISFFISVFVFPVWAGDDLHDLATGNLEKLANTMESVAGALEGKNKSLLDGHKGVLHSKFAEDSLANLVWWEPPHGRFRFRHPWDHYLKLGEESRRCAYLMEALNIYIQTSDNYEFDSDLLVACTGLSAECCKALREAASAVRLMKIPSAATKGCVASEQMKMSTLMENCGDVKRMLRVAPIVSVLIEIFGCTQSIAATVEELARQARFESAKKDSEAAVKPANETEGLDHITIAVEE